MNEHLIAFNTAKLHATQQHLNQFTFRGNVYERGMWRNGVQVWRSRLLRSKKMKKKKKKSKKSRQ
jgi:hypothetical protein